MSEDMNQVVELRRLGAEAGTDELGELDRGFFLGQIGQERLSHVVDVAWVRQLRNTSREHLPRGTSGRD